MPEVSRMVQGLEQSGIRKVMALADGVPDIIHLEVGEPLFQTPEHIVRAGQEALSHGYTKYTANWGIASLRKAIAENRNDDYGLELDESNIGVTVGGVGAVSGIVRAIVDAGERVLVPDPGWPNYAMIVRTAGAEVGFYRLSPEEGFLPTVDALEEALTPDTKAIIINSPSNPLGTVFPAAVMKEVVDFASRHDLFVISDEVYEKIIFDGRHVTAGSLDIDGRVIVASSFSKTYAMTGWRVGYAAADENIIRQLAKLQEAFVSCAPGVSQKAAEAALMGPQDCVGEMRSTYQRNRDAAVDALTDAGISFLRPKGAFYIWVDLGCEDSTRFCQEFLRQKKVAVAPGSTFGPSGEGFIRISLASREEDIREGIRRLAQFI